MSLRSYLFSLMGGLILILTVSQLFLIYWLEQNLAQELDDKALHISQEVIELAFKEIEVDGKNEMMRTRVASGKEHIFISDEQIDLEIDDSSHLGDKELKGKLEKIVQQLHHNKSLSSNLEVKRKIIINVNDTQAQQVWLEKPHELGKSRQLIQAIQLGLIASAIIALIFAYWLSIQFNKPLKLLTSGFKRLSLGQYHQKVPEEGVKEIRIAIAHFNTMLTRLKELTLLEQYQQESAHLAELGEVSRGLAHTLRNPIHTIGLSLEQLAQKDNSPEQQALLLNTAQNKISHIDKNIKALLTLTFTGVIRDEEVLILPVVQDIILEYKCASIPLPEHKIDFKVSINDKLSILGAEPEIRSILHTMIINACEANQLSSEKKFSSSINISAQIENNALSIVVEDQGEGIIASVEKQLFKPHISTKPEGAGMGLYIAKRIISLHYNGDLTLANQVNTRQKFNGCVATAMFSLSPLTTDASDKL